MKLTEKEICGMAVQLFNLVGSLRDRYDVAGLKLRDKCFGYQHVIHHDILPEIQSPFATPYTLTMAREIKRFLYRHRSKF